MLSKSFFKAFSSFSTSAAWRRAWRSSRFARVTIFSARLRSSLALAAVVMIFSYRRSEVTRLRIIISRCAVVRPSLRPARRCRMAAGPPDRPSGPARLLPFGRLPPGGLAHGQTLQLHAQAKTHPRQDLLDLVQRLPAE